MSTQLVLINGNRNLPVADFKLAPGEYTVGRSSDCELPISDPTISRQHARLVVDESTIQVTDLGSRNGTYLQGAPIQTGTATIGQQVRFGRVIFTIDDLSRYLPPPHSDECQTADFRPSATSESGMHSLLTPSQMRVLACMLEGMTEKEAAKKLGLSRHTVHNHIRDIYTQLGVRSRGELLSKFISTNQDPMVSPPPPHGGKPTWRHGETQPELDVPDLD